MIAVDVGDDVRAHRVCQQYKITRLPVTMLFDQGRAVDFIGGMTTFEGLAGMVEKRLATVREVTDIDFEREVLGSKLPVLVHVYSAACRFSIPLGDIVESVAAKYQERAKTVRLDFDGQSAQIRARYGFNRVPLVAMFQGGELVDQIYGGISDAARSDEARMRSERSSRLGSISEMVEQFAL